MHLSIREAAKNKQIAIERDRCECQKCGSHNGILAHHLIPKRFGGSDDISNLAAVCYHCHLKIHRCMGLTRSKTHANGIPGFPDNVNDRLMSFLENENISAMDTPAVIARAVDMYLQHLAAEDTGLSGVLEDRRAARVRKGKASREKARK